MDKLNRKIYQDAVQKRKVSSWVASKISDLLILAESLRQLGLFQPWAKASTISSVRKSTALKAAFSESMSDLTKIESEMSQLSVAEEGNPSSIFFLLPDRPAKIPAIGRLHATSRKPVKNFLE